MAMLLAAGALGLAGGSLLAGWLNPGSTTTNVDVAEGGTVNLADENQETDDDGFLGGLGGIMEFLPLFLLMKFI